MMWKKMMGEGRGERRRWDRGEDGDENGGGRK